MAEPVQDSVAANRRVIALTWRGVQLSLVVVGLSPFYQLIAVGVVLIAAVYLDTRRTKGMVRFRR